MIDNSPDCCQNPSWMYTVFNLNGEDITYSIGGYVTKDTAEMDARNDIDDFMRMGE